MSDHLEDVKSLHQALIDSRNGYEEALKESKAGDLVDLFRDMIALRNKDSASIANELSKLGVDVDDHGSFMTLVHKTVIDVREILTGLNESILPGLIDGESRIVTYYDKAIDSADVGTPDHALLVSQRETLSRKIDDMKNQEKITAQK